MPLISHTVSDVVGCDIDHKRKLTTTIKSFYVSILSKDRECLTKLPHLLLLEIILITALCLKGVQAAGPPPVICTADQYISQLANVSTFQTSATLLASVLVTLGGAPRNSTVFVPTDAAWTKFRSVNGAFLPSYRRNNIQQWGSSPQ